MADITKVFYFAGIRARGEFIRMVLTAANQKFEDVGIKLQDWKSDPELKKAAPFGKLPYIIYKGKKWGQSIALASYFAKKFGFYGKTDEDAFRQEEVMQLVEDIRVPHVRDWFLTENADFKAEKAHQLKTELFPQYLMYFEAILAENGDNGFFVGQSVTLADMYLYDFLVTVVGIDPEALKNFHLLQKLFENVESMPTLKSYLAKRPKTDM